MMSPTQPFSYHIPVEQPNPVTNEKSNQIGVCDKIAESAKRSAAVGLALILFPVAKTIAITGSVTTGGVNGILIPAYVIRWVIKSKNETQKGFWNKSFGKKFNFFKEVGRKPAYPFNRSFEYLAAVGFKNHKQKVEKINAKIDSIIGSAGTGIGTAVGGGISLVGVAAVGAVSALIIGIGQSIANPYSCHHHHYHHHHYRSRC